MAIQYHYTDAIKCMSCGSNDVEVKHTPSGIEHCTCRQCGKRFVVQTEGVELLDQYLAARAQIFTALEMTKLNRDTATKALRELENLVKSFAVLAEIDTVYYWYKIVVLTENFTDYARLSEAEREHLNISKSACYFLTNEDMMRHERYQKQYNAYLAKKQEDAARAAKRKRKKKKAIAGAVVGSIFALLIGAGAFTVLYEPTVSDSETGVSVQASNGACGLFGKFQTKIQACSYTEADDEYATAEHALQETTEKISAIGLSVTQNNAEFALKGSLTVTLPVPDDFYKGQIGVYAVYEDGTAAPLPSEVSEEKNTVSFKTEQTGVFAVTELPLVVSFTGIGSANLPEQKVYYGNTLREVAVTREGYTFAGWQQNSVSFDTSAPITKDVTLSAQWNANEYTVTYVLDDKEVKSDTATYDDEFTLYAPPEKEGYKLQWMYGDTRVKNGVWKIADHVRLNGVWKEIQSVITFVNGTADCCPAETANETETEASYDQLLPSITPPRRTGYLFNGYYTEADGQGAKQYESDGTSSVIWKSVEDTTFYADWKKDDRYAGYTYLESIADLTKVRDNPSGKYLLTRDLDLHGNSREPFPDFSGIFDGGGHAVYNFVIETGTEDGSWRHFGFFSQVSGTVQNLQVGKENYETKMSFEQWHLRPVAGMVCSYLKDGGKIENCRAIGCKISLWTRGNRDSYKGQKWYAWAGGICGNGRKGSIVGCYAEGCDLSTESAAQYNKIVPFAATGGIVGYAEDVTVADCFVKNCNFQSSATRYGGGLQQAGNPYARSGGIIGETGGNTVISRCVATGNTLKATKSGGSGEATCGTIVGCSSQSTPSDLIGIDTDLLCNGINANYPGYNRITTDSYEDLISVAPAFNNGYWKSDDGKILLDFYGNLKK